MSLKRLCSSLRLLSWKQGEIDHRVTELPLLRRRALLTIGISLTSLVGVLSATSSAILTKGYANLETRLTQRNLDRVIESYNQEISSLANLNQSWSIWDDSYQFVQHPDSEFITKALASDVSLQASADVVAYFNKAGKVIYGTGYPTAEDTVLPLDADLSHVSQYSQLFQSLQALHPSASQQSHTPKCQTGVMLLPETPLLYTACPILTSNSQGPVAGTLLMARYVNATFTQYLTRTTRLHVSFYSLRDINRLSPDLQAAYQHLQTASTFIQPLNSQQIAGYQIIRSHDATPALLVQITLPREIYQQGRRSLLYLILSVAIVGVLFGITTYLLSERSLLLWQRQREYEARYKVVIDQASEGIVLVDGLSKRLLETNSAFNQLLGYSPAELAALTLYDIDTADPVAVDHTMQSLKTAAFDCADERQYRHCNGQIVDVEVSTNQIEYADRLVYSLIVRDITERKRAEAALRESEQRLAWQASHDALTGLVNRRQFEQYLEQAIKIAQTQVQQHTLCYLDLDQFKVVNDTCGHHAGDELLRQVTALLQMQVRSSDILARLGGDEFGLLLQYCPPDQAVYIAEILRQSVQDFRFVWQDKIFSIGVSIGLVEINARSQDLVSVLSIADTACYLAKNGGRNRVYLYEVTEDCHLLQQQEMQWAKRITEALDENRLCLYCQPIIPFKVSALATEYYEVLVRLQDESGKIIAPSAFIPAAERHNLMPLIDRWVIHTLFASQGNYYRQEGQDLPQNRWYAINLSGASINDSTFSKFLHHQFAYHQIPPQRICFEISETTAISHLSRVSQFVQEFKQLGCRFALDDFGSGISSFACLKQLPVDFLKIDGTFIKDILHDPLDLALVEAINQVGHVMGLQTIAEFVQDQTTLRRLGQVGVDYVQGYGISPPLPLVCCTVPTAADSAGSAGSVGSVGSSVQPQSPLDEAFSLV